MKFILCVLPALLYLHSPALSSVSKMATVKDVKKGIEKYWSVEPFKFKHMTILKEATIDKLIKNIPDKMDKTIDFLSGEAAQEAEAVRKELKKKSPKSKDVQKSENAKLLSMESGENSRAEAICKYVKSNLKKQVDWVSTRVILSHINCTSYRISSKTILPYLIIPIYERFLSKTILPSPIIPEFTLLGKTIVVPNTNRTTVLLRTAKLSYLITAHIWCLFSLKKRRTTMCCLPPSCIK